MPVRKTPEKGNAAASAAKKNTSGKGGKNSRKAAVFTFGAAIALYSLMFPLFRAGDYILCGAVSFLLARLVSALTSGIGQRQEAADDQNGAEESAVMTGDALADEVIERGREMIWKVREENKKNPDESLSAKMNELERVSLMILAAIEEKPYKATQVRRFIDYYLPTTLKMLEKSRMLDEKQLYDKDAEELRAHILSGVSSVIAACHKLLGNLYKDEILDVNTDIDALRQILKRDGLTDGDFSVTNE